MGKSFLEDKHIQIPARKVSFKGKYYRYDLLVVEEKEEDGNRIVLDLNGNRFTHMKLEDVEKEGFLEHALQLTEIEAEDIKPFLREILS
ncbi:SAV0927 family protein [Radiobacillus deserti]|nr:SAV0927 family protein [Radiobacillus deserti]